MDLQPTLVGSLIRLRPLAQEDFPALFAAASDPRIWELHPAPDRYYDCSDIFIQFCREIPDPAV